MRTKSATPEKVWAAIKELTQAQKELTQAQKETEKERREGERLLRESQKKTEAGLRGKDPCGRPKRRQRKPGARGRGF